MVFTGPPLWLVHEIFYLQSSFIQGRAISDLKNCAALRINGCWPAVSACVPVKFGYLPDEIPPVLNLLDFTACAVFRICYILWIENVVTLSHHLFAVGRIMIIEYVVPILFLWEFSGGMGPMLWDLFSISNFWHLFSEILSVSACDHSKKRYT